ncbi:MAG: hypothetical protein H0U73_12155 [Tatlockia sp.]|nr:hypothetical protein [Tatlockia sp.]
MTVFQQLQQQSYAHIPFPMDSKWIQQAIDAFFLFLKEPESVKNHINFTIAPNHRRGDVGYKHREANEHIYNDSKEFFHFHPAIFNKYESFLEKNPVVADFVMKAKPIWDAVYKTMHHLLSLFEEKFPGIVTKVFATEDEHIQLRFLKYDWQHSGKYLAKPHFDAGSCTLAIAESCAGLRIGTCPEDLKLIEHREQQAIFMLASNYKVLFDTAVLLPGWHDVIQLDDSCIGKPFARWAIVAFIEAHGVKALPRSETHKWI